MTPRLRRTLTGVGLALSLALPARALPAGRGDRAARTVHHAASGWSWLHALWQLVMGNPNVPLPTQGPTVDPNGLPID